MLAALHAKNSGHLKAAPQFSAVQLPGSGAFSDHAAQTLTSMDPYQPVISVQPRAALITSASGAVGLTLSAKYGDDIWAQRAAELQRGLALLLIGLAAIAGPDRQDPELCMAAAWSAPSGRRGMVVGLAGEAVIRWPCAGIR